MEYVDTKAVSAIVADKAREWRQTSTPEQNPKSKEPKTTQSNLSGKVL